MKAVGGDWRLPAASAGEIFILTSTMEFSVYGDLNKPGVIILVCVAILTLLITIYFASLNNDDERPVNFTIPLPEQCKPGWKGEVLDGPKIKA